MKPGARTHTCLVRDLDEQLKGSRDFARGNWRVWPHRLVTSRVEPLRRAWHVTCTYARLLLHCCYRWARLLNVLRQYACTHVHRHACNHLTVGTKTWTRRQEETGRSRDTPCGSPNVSSLVSYVYSSDASNGTLWNSAVCATVELRGLDLASSTCVVQASTCMGCKLLDALSRGRNVPFTKADSLVV